MVFDSYIESKAVLLVNNEMADLLGVKHLLESYPTVPTLKDVEPNLVEQLSDLFELCLLNGVVTTGSKEHAHMRRIEELLKGRKDRGDEEAEARSSREEAG